MTCLLVVCLLCNVGCVINIGYERECYDTLFHSQYDDDEDNYKSLSSVFMFRPPAGCSVEPPVSGPGDREGS